MEFDISKVMELLPHRYPFLLVDRVVELENGKSLSAIKNVSINEPFFQGHFPGQPVMPGVLILEAMAQATGLLAFTRMGDDYRDKLYLLVGIGWDTWVDPTTIKEPAKQNNIAERAKQGRLICTSS